MHNIGDEIRIQGYSQEQYSGRITRIRPKVITVRWYIKNDQSSLTELDYSEDLIRYKPFSPPKYSFYNIGSLGPIKPGDLVKNKIQYLWSKSNYAQQHSAHA